MRSREVELRRGDDMIPYTVDYEIVRNERGWATVEVLDVTDSDGNTVSDRSIIDDLAEALTDICADEGSLYDDSDYWDDRSE